MTDYIKTMRGYVGHRPIMQVGASVVIIREDGAILLQRRSDNGLWGYHGGSVELGEDTRDAAKRELFEETALTAEDLELHGVYSGKDTFYRYPNGDEVSNVDVVFLCRDWEGTLRAQAGEVEELRFVAPEDLPADLMPPNRPVFADWLRRRGNGGQ